MPTANAAVAKLAVRLAGLGVRPAVKSAVVTSSGRWAAPCGTEPSMDGLRTDLPILESIGAYRLLKHLGANGPVQVYLGRGERSGRPSGDVVLKIVSGLADEDAKKIEEL